ncbi:hypothetical protein JQ600_35630 [Bradyrhizobium sp. AUGA SZCCT0176]|nr:hypothetical protein [Bradyrhizobium sp. AUGA SZCCT0176]
MHAAIHDPVSETTVTAREFAEARRKRLARIEARAYRAPVAEAPPEVKTIEIVDLETDDTTIEVTACNGQIVVVTETQIAEVREVFEKLTVSGGGLRIENIQRAVCRKFNLSRIDFLSMRRTKDLVVPRQVAMYLCKTLTLKSLPEIGRHFNGKDHTTVLHAVRKMERLVQVDETISGVINELKEELHAELVAQHGV